MDYNFDPARGAPNQNTQNDSPSLPSFSALVASVKPAPRRGTTTPTPSPASQQSAPLTLSRITLPPVLLSSPVRPHFWAAFCVPSQYQNPHPILLELSFAGAPTPFLLPDTGPTALPPRIARRVRASLLAARIDAAHCGGMYVDLNLVAVETLPRMSQAEFTFLVGELAPTAYTAPATREETCDVRAWRMTCPHCAAQMFGGPKDGAWNAQYVRHLSEGWCTGQPGYVPWKGGSAVQGGAPLGGV
ncbi:hypothetical protein HYPSUDRAFT_49460 [Hypholoma sublateritium FD-334 SS-4]|uniref:Uncharacterized protein n=1 Tax=Hypholoma sublateritium (strain FD-334 SS-4) TaxID=945553 RepID=A0A0D2KHD3_HYPSF|nr:hypothetical protein HYPSUDRAFT_49460 [Hypholoma sublateritium FD-334 SS-4]